MKLVKLFLQKLAVGVIGFGAFFVILFAAASFLGSIASLFTFSKLATPVIGIGVPVLIVIAVICPYRAKDSKTRKAYLEHMDGPGFGIKKELTYMLRFSEFYMEIFVFELLLFPVFLLAVRLNGSNISGDTFVTALCVGVIALVPFAVTDICVWQIVHVYWRRTLKKLKKGSSKKE